MAATTYSPSGELPDYTDDMQATAQHTNGDYTNSYDAQPQDEEEEDEDYDPSAFEFAGSTAQTTQIAQTVQEAAPAAALPPKTVGGFILEESSDADDEEDLNENEDTSMSNTQAQPAEAQQQLNGVEHGVQDVAMNMSGDDGASASALPLASEPTSSAHHTSMTEGLTASGSLLTATAPDSVSAPASTDAVQAAVLPSSTIPAAAVPPELITQQQNDDEGKPPTTQPPTVAPTPQPQANGDAVPPTPTTARLPHDKVGRLEDRIKEDPKSDVEAWWELIGHYRDKDQLDNARAVYARMLEVWGTNPTIYLSYLSLENTVFDRQRIETLFGTALPLIPSLPLWTQYLSYLRRVFPLIPDPDGSNRSTILAGFTAVLEAVGQDPESQNLWREYIDFIKSGPGVLGGEGWQDKQKVDQLRAAYQQAVKVPSGGVMAVWKEYDGFEMGVDKRGARKWLQEVSPHYMTARTAEKQLSSILIGLDRAVVARLPPVEGCEGDDAFAAQVGKWRSWVEWEKSDPLVLKEEDVVAYRKRVVFVLRLAVVGLRFWPRIWAEAAGWCFEQVGGGDVVTEFAAMGEGFLEEGLRANPESVLLTLRKADRLEEGFHSGGSAEEGVVVREGGELEGVFEPCLAALYALVKKGKEKSERGVNEVKSYFAGLEPEEEKVVEGKDDDGDSNAGSEASPVLLQKEMGRAEQMAARIKVITDAAKEQQKILSKTISALWIAKMRAFRRVQGQGAPGKPRKGFRGVFAEARPRGQLSADVYVASALMEWHGYKDPSALKIFERGMRLFAFDEEFAVGYMQHLINTNDLTNARVVFETTVTKILGAGDKLFSVEERKGKVGVLLGFMHRFESGFGELAAVRRLEGRMRELFPEAMERDGGMGLWGSRFEVGGFDALGVQLVLSERQVRAKSLVGVEGQVMITMPDGGRVPMPVGMPPGMPALPVMGGEGEGGLRLGPNGPYVASPKRGAESDTEGEGPRKYARTESPGKGGRRGGGHVGSKSVAEAANGNNANGGGGGFAVKTFVPGAGATVAPVVAAPPPVFTLPEKVQIILQLLPNERAYRGSGPGTVFLADRMVELLRGVDVEGAKGRMR
ncbi:mRNA 3'-end-processing protein rna14 [Elasticomyces elasticus]|nr:mRNA 3'-end-processing protein rna14 [Elasticomyces elasticus]KAK3635020.1 mRNA 3'-end-processing protein rna14 [Elasticomyces elasticus]KAK4902945.1 mRNA 3'-end-processing protein rna14 [Elasticomyces elasticus]KAK5739945.1 mRNA 3'-end-processing protein rna14 [Elasticomyces elasticus]